MGNTPSSVVEGPGPVAKRPTHKLSKPRTGKHATTTAGLLSSPSGFSINSSSRRLSNSRLSTQLLPFTPVSDASSPATGASPPSALSSEGGPGIPGENTQRKGSLASVGLQKEARRRSLFRSKSSQEPKSSSRRKSLISAAANLSLAGSLSRSNSVADVPPVPRYRDSMGRTNSLADISPVPGPGYRGSMVEPLRPPVPGPRASWTYDMTSYETQRLMNLVEETTMEQRAATLENKMTVVSESTWKSSHPPLPQASSTPITRANSDLSLYTPVRRRSIIQTPGVATRTSPAPRPSFRFSHPPTPSSLSRQPSIESYRDGLLSMPPLLTPPLPVDPDSIPRVVTPCEDNYQSLGAFKHGSLRITNGAASPISPQTERGNGSDFSKQIKSSGKRDGNYVASEQIESPDAIHESPQKTEEAAEAMKVEAPQPRPAKLRSASSIANSLLGVGVDSKNRHENKPASKEAARPVLENPLSAYLADIQKTSPFKLELLTPNSPGLEITSKHIVHEDKLLEDDGQLEYSSLEVLDVRLDPSAKSQPSSNNDEVARKVLRTDSGLGSEGSSSSEAPHKSLSKADSGYSSNVSLRSFHSKVRSPNGKPALPLEKHSSFKSQGSSAVSSDEENNAPNLKLTPCPAEPERDAPPPPVPLKDPQHSLPTLHIHTKTTGSSTPANPVTSAPSNDAHKTKHVPSPINSAGSPVADLSSMSPSSFPRTPGSAKSTRSDASISALSIGSGSHKPSKLQRLLSGARRPLSGPFTVHATHVNEKSSVPAIPQAIETSLQERSGLFPMTTKRLALKPKTSKDTLKTIFSVGSFETTLDSGSRPSSVAVVQQDDSVLLGETGAGPDLVRMGSIKSTGSSGTFSIRRKPVPVRKNFTKEKEAKVGNAAESESIVPVEAELTSYRSISCSLGNNAYDAALRAISTESSGTYSVHAPTGRTKSLTMAADRHLSLVAPSSTGPTNLPSPPLPSPLLAWEMMHLQTKAKTPPPVSMMTRRPVSLRVPSLLRPQTAAGRLGGESVLQKRSCENIRGYPSQKKCWGDVDDQAPPIPPLHPRRSLTVQGAQSIRDAQLGSASSRPSSATSSDLRGRRTSLPANQAGHGISRPGSAQSWKSPPSQTLRHRASYDGSGHRPAPSRNYSNSSPSGQMAPSMPLYDLWSSYHQYGTPPDSWDQLSRYPQPPPIPRGHYRNRSMSSGQGPAPPYRVLHSYNSPAYRNVPIWG